MQADRNLALMAIGVVVAAHAGAITALLHYEPAQRALAAAAPTMVSLIAAPRLEAPPAPPKEPESRPVPKTRAQPVQKPVKPAPLIAASAPATSTLVAPPAPTPIPEPVTHAKKDEPAPAPPAPVDPPRFNADYLHNPAPTYPSLSRRMGEQGRVLLRVLVSADGLADRVEVRSSSGSPRLDESALETVRRWKFVPARQGEQPVAAWVLVPISFSLKG
jgi:protein TonB